MKYNKTNGDISHVVKEDLSKVKEGEDKEKKEKDVYNLHPKEKPDWKIIEE